MLLRILDAKGLLNYSHFLQFFFLFTPLDCFSNLPSKWLIKFPASSNLLFIPYSVFFIADTISFISDLSFFIVSMSFSLLFFILVTIAWHSISDKLLVSILFSLFSGSLFCSLIWGMFLCFPISAAFLCLFLCNRYIWYDSQCSWCGGLCSKCPVGQWCTLLEYLSCVS